MAHVLERLARGRAHAGRPARLLERARRAPCAGARRRRARAAASCVGRAGPVRRRRTSAESTFGTGRNTLREIGRTNFDVAGELDQHGRDAVGLRAGLCREPVGDLALHHHAPEVRPPAAPRSSSGSPDVRRRREGSRPPCSAAGRARRGAASSRRRCTSVVVARGPRAPRAAPARAARRSRPRARGATRGARYALSTPRPPPISSTTSLRVELGGAADHLEDVVVDQEVLAQLAIGPDAEAATCGRGSRGPRSPVEEPGGVGDEQLLQLLVGDAAQLGQIARRRASRTPARSACRAAPAARGTGASVSTSSSSSGTARGGLLQVGRLRIGDVAGERAVPAALDALLARGR